VRANGWWESFRRKKNWIRGQEKKIPKQKFRLGLRKRTKKKLANHLG